MSRAKKKVLVLVEGAKTDVTLMEKLFDIYPELDAKYEIVSYCTNIYVLYQEFFPNGILQESLDLLQVLKAREVDPVRKCIFDDKYTDILLVFDLDPHDPSFTPEKISLLQEYFCESSDAGKLYLNYPMVESFYHMATIPDPAYIDRTATLHELRQRTYKTRVNQESKGRDYQKYISNRAECNTVILQNAEKSFRIQGMQQKPTEEWVNIDFTNVLKIQLKYLESGFVHVLCTCALYIYDYNPAFLFNT